MLNEAIQKINREISFIKYGVSNNSNDKKEYISLLDLLIVDDKNNVEKRIFDFVKSYKGNKTTRYRAALILAMKEKKYIFPFREHGLFEKTHSVLNTQFNCKFDYSNYCKYLKIGNITKRGRDNGIDEDDDRKTLELMNMIINKI